MGIAAMVLASRKMQTQGDKVTVIAGLLYTGLTVLLLVPLLASEQMDLNRSGDF